MVVDADAPNLSHEKTRLEIAQLRRSLEVDSDHAAKVRRLELARLKKQVETHWALDGLLRLSPVLAVVIPASISVCTFANSAQQSQRLSSSTELVKLMQIVSSDEKSTTERQNAARALSLFGELSVRVLAASLTGFQPTEVRDAIQAALIDVAVEDDQAQAVLDSLLGNLLMLTERIEERDRTPEGQSPTSHLRELLAVTFGVVDEVPALKRVSRSVARCLRNVKERLSETYVAREHGERLGSAFKKYNPERLLRWSGRQASPVNVPSCELPQS